MKYIMTLFFALSLLNSPSNERYNIANQDTEPTLLHPGTISQDLPQWNNYFNRKLSIGLFTQLKGNTTRIIYYPYVNGQFLEGEYLPFDPQFNYSDPWINLEGDYMLMQADIDQNGGKSQQFNICESFYTEKGWTQPRPIKALANVNGNEGSPSLTKNGDLYFNAKNDEGDFDIFVLKKGAKEPEVLPQAINSNYYEGDFYIDGEEQFIIFSSAGRSNSQGDSDLYISFKEKGEWTDSVPLNKGINSEAEDFSPYVSMDRTKLIFTSNRLNSTSLRPSYNHFIVDINLNEMKKFYLD